MSKRSVGVGFCLISALLYSARHLATAILAQGASLSSTGEEFDAYKRFQGGELLYLSLVALLIGLVYLAWGEYEALGLRD